MGLRFSVRFLGLESRVVLLVGVGGGVQKSIQPTKVALFGEESISKGPSIRCSHSSPSLYYYFSTNLLGLCTFKVDEGGFQELRFYGFSSKGLDLWF